MAVPAETMSLLPQEPRDFEPPRLLELYAQARQAGVAIDEETGFVVVSKHADVKEAFANPDLDNRLTLANHCPVHQDVGRRVGQLIPQIPAVTAAGNGPRHRLARKRTMAELAFGFERVKEKYGGLIRQRVGEMADAIAEKALTISRLGGVAVGPEIDLLPFLWNLPHDINATILGFRPEQFKDIKDASVGQVKFIGSEGSYDEQMQSVDGLEKMWEMSKQLVADCIQDKKNGKKRDDLTTRLLEYLPKDGEVATEEDLTQDELSAIVMNLAVAGHETESNFLTYSLEYVGNHPKIKALAERKPQKIDAIIRELLRLCPSLDKWSRYAARETTVGGVIIPEDKRVLLWLGAANRDPAVFKDPDSFKLERHNANAYLTFGANIPGRPEDSHYCLGASLARVVGAEVLRVLIQRFPDMRLADQNSEREKNIIFHVKKSLRMNLGDPRGWGAKAA